jgi:hypothetical protein
MDNYAKCRIRCTRNAASYYPAENFYAKLVPYYFAYNFYANLVPYCFADSFYANLLSYSFTYNSRANSFPDVEPYSRSC